MHALKKSFNAIFHHCARDGSGAAPSYQQLHSICKFFTYLRLNNPETIESRRIGNQTSKNPLTNLKYSYFRVKIQTWQKHVPSQSRLRLKWWNR